MNWNVVQLYIILLQLSRLQWDTHCLRACLSLFVSLEMSTQKLYKSVKPAIITMASTDIGVAQGKSFHLEPLISCLLCPKQFWSYYEKKAKCIVWNFIYLFYRFSTFRDFRPAVNKHYSAFSPLSPHPFVSACYCFSAFSDSKWIKCCCCVIQQWLEKAALPKLFWLCAMNLLYHCLWNGCSKDGVHL